MSLEPKRVYWRVESLACRSSFSYEKAAREYRDTLKREGWDPNARVKNISVYDAKARRADFEKQIAEAVAEARRDERAKCVAEIVASLEGDTARAEMVDIISNCEAPWKAANKAIKVAIDCVRLAGGK